MTTATRPNHICNISIKTTSFRGTTVTKGEVVQHRSPQRPGAALPLRLPATTYGPLSTSDGGGGRGARDLQPGRLDDESLGRRRNGGGARY